MKIGGCGPRSTGSRTNSSTTGAGIVSVVRRGHSIAGRHSPPTRPWVRDDGRESGNAPWIAGRSSISSGDCSGKAATDMPPRERLHNPVHYYYDVLVGLETLVRLGYGDDPRTKPARDLLRRKMRPDGRWTTEAVHPDLARGANYSREPGARRFVLERLHAPSKWITLRAVGVLGEP